MSNQVVGPYLNNNEQVITTDSSYTLSPNHQVVVVIDTDVTLTLPPNPQIGEFHFIVANDGKVRVLGGANSIRPDARLVRDGSAKYIIWSGTEWIPEGPGGSSDDETNQIVYVTKDGSDTDGDGSFDDPFLTIGRAMDSIVTNSPTTLFLIDVGPGQYADPWFTKPWVCVKGANSANNPVSFSSQTSITEITAPTNTMRFDPTWLGQGVAWMENLTFTNGQTWNQGTNPGIQPQLNYGSCSFLGAMQYDGPGTSSNDTVSWNNCIANGNVTVSGWGEFWTRSTEFLGGGAATISITSPALATETTTWNGQNCSINADVLLTGTGPQLARIFWDNCSQGIGDSSTINGTFTLFEVAESGPRTVVLMGGATNPTIANAYIPAVLANWSGVNPATVTQALDRIAAKITPIP